MRWINTSREQALDSEDLFDKSGGFGEFVVKFNVESLFLEHGSSKIVRIEIVA